MSMTLLAAVEEVLPRINADSVSSISDTPEASQIAQLCLSVYRDMIAKKSIPLSKRLIKLDASGDSTYPTHMKLPANTINIQDTVVRYNKRTSTDTVDKYATVAYISPEEFLAHTMVRDATQSEVDVVTEFVSGATLLIRNDTAPLFFTSFDDEWLVFDSYDSAVDSTLQQSKTVVHAEVMRRPTLADDSSLEMPPALEGFFINNCILAAQQLEEGFDAYAQREARDSSYFGRRQRVTRGMKIKPVYRRR